MADEKKTGTPTGYRILKETGDNSVWSSVVTVKASSATSAIRAAVAKLAPADQSGTFIAVPERSWKPVRVAPKTTVQLELTEVKP